MNIISTILRWIGVVDEQEFLDTEIETMAPPKVVPRGSARMVGGPWCGAWFPRGSEYLRVAVVTGTPDQMDGARALYRWDGKSRWRFERFVGADEDVRQLCVPNGCCGK